LIEYGLTSN